MRFLEQEERDEVTSAATAVRIAKIRRHEPKARNRRAERRGDQRRDAEHDRNRGELQPRLATFEQVADDRPRQDADRAGARALHERKASSTPIDGASAAPAEAGEQDEATAMITLRPNRSESGPTMIGAVEKPAMKMAIAAAAFVCGA